MTKLTTADKIPCNFYYITDKPLSYENMKIFCFTSEYNFNQCCFSYMSMENFEIAEKQRNKIFQHNCFISPSESKDTINITLTRFKKIFNQIFSMENQKEINILLKLNSIHDEFMNNNDDSDDDSHNDQLV